MVHIKKKKTKKKTPHPPWFSLPCAPEWPRGPGKHRFLGPILRISDQWARDRAQEYAFHTRTGQC